jgi:soluble lytic murein transglycosylase-like protein
LANAPANAQAGATPATSDRTAGEANNPTAQPPTVDDICHALERSAAEYGLPVEYFARVIWQESRFDAQAVSPKGAAGIPHFMPATASWHGLAYLSVGNFRSINSVLLSSNFGRRAK